MCRIIHFYRELFCTHNRKMLFALAIVGVFVLSGCALCLGALCLCFSIPFFHIFKHLLNSKVKARGTDGEWNSIF